MRFSIDIPNFGPFGDPRLAVQVARDAEAAGWDAVWVWDHIVRDPSQPVEFADPWLLLTAIATATTSLRFGPMMLALPRRRPWIVARESVTLDRLSGGRLTLGVGLGHPAAEYSLFGEEPDLRTRAEKLDESLAILTGLWSGQPFEHHGTHFDLARMTFLPTPVQQPRIPVWVAGTWPIRAPFRRAARWDGIWPETRDENDVARSPTPSQVRELTTYVRDRRVSDDPFDVMIAGHTPGDDPSRAAELVAAYSDAGATWWTERINPKRGSLDDIRARVRQGPPRI